jgi:hypothetical protein
MNSTNDIIHRMQKNLEGEHGVTTYEMTSQKIAKYSQKRKMNTGNNPDMMEGLCSVM